MPVPGATFNRKAKGPKGLASLFVVLVSLLVLRLFVAVSSFRTCHAGQMLSSRLLEENCVSANWAPD